MIRFSLRDLALLLMTFALGCSPSTEDEQSSTEAESDATPGYLGAIAGAKKSMEGDITLAPLQQAITAFKVAEGRNPASLKELVVEEYIAALPDAPYKTTLRYDAETGVVSIDSAE